MLKKTGLVVVLMAATTVAASPLAFAGDKSPEPHRTDYRSSYERTEDNDTTSRSDSSVDREQYNRCYFEQSEGSSADSPLLGALGSQLQTLNCTNVGDQTVLDLDGEDGDVVLDGTDGAATPAG